MQAFGFFFHLCYLSLSVCTFWTTTYLSRYFVFLLTIRSFDIQEIAKYPLIHSRYSEILLCSFPKCLEKYRLVPIIETTLGERVFSCSSEKVKGLKLQKWVSEFRLSSFIGAFWLPQVFLWSLQYFMSWNIFLIHFYVSAPEMRLGYLGLHTQTGCIPRTIQSGFSCSFSSIGKSLR